MDFGDLADRLELAKASVSELQHDGNRARLLAASRELVAALEIPEEKLMGMAKGPVGHAVLRAALKLGLFERFDDVGKVTAEKLAIDCGVEFSLLVRIMRTLIGMGIFNEDDKETYSSNKLSKSLSNPSFRSIITGMCETTTIMPSLPDYLASINFQNPTDRHRSLSAYANNTDLNTYEWIQSHPEKLKIFNEYQSSTAELWGFSLKRILQTLLSPRTNKDPSKKSSGEDEVILVDIGGGYGKTLREVCKQTPDLQGRVIIQDLPKVIEGQEAAHGVEFMSYDFFTPQPIHGCSDSDCHQILQNLVPALKPGVSRVVIIDVVLPEKKVSEFNAFMDISMMAFGGMERTEIQWRDVLQKAGFSIESIQEPVNVFRSPDSVIEAVLAT